MLAHKFISLLILISFFWACNNSKKITSVEFQPSIDLLEEKIDTLPIVEPPSYFQLQNAIYKPSIKSVFLYPQGFELGNPLLRLGSSETLSLSFDELTENPKNYYYTYTHCNADWTPSDLLQSEYIDGFFEEVITNYQFSFNTIQNYIHYTANIPSQRMKPMLSGNYILQVFDETNRDKPILSKRFMVIDEQVSIEGSVKRATDLNQRNYQHEIDFTVKHPAYEIDNPFSDIFPVILQNGRWDNSINGLQAVFVKDQEIVYDYEEENCFDAGNEYRFFEFQSLRYLSERLSNIYFENDTNKIHLITDYPRPFQRYSSLVQDINGKCLVRVQEGSQSQTEADYALVRFTLTYEHEVTHGDLYVFGQISDFEFPKTHKMKYNAETGQYECDIYLKQGYYNYEYVLKKYDGETLNRFIEGTHYQTVNDYYIYIYHRPTGEQYDQLIGLKKLTSKDLL
ncbi:MAG: DUF5103 domain-containing protein [Bacteroidota bacterium]|nr:DUF5103 domain-containing protein [Bacteroidota bacterium]